jgi:ACR3 family arsenite efflux pump ArsB
MTGFERAQPFLVLLSVILGLAFTQVAGLPDLAARTIVPLLGVMLYATFLPLSLKQFGQRLRNPRVILTSLATNFLWTPVFAWGLGALFLQDAPDLWVGLLMLMVTPCTDWYLVFTGVAGGDVTLATALLPLNLVLQILLLPVYLLVLAGALVELNLFSLLPGLFWVLLIPLLAASLSRKVISAQTEKAGFERILSQVGKLQLLSLNLAIVAIFASEGNAILEQPELLLKLFVPIVLFFGVNFLLAYGIGRYLRFSYGAFACFACTTLARNSPLSLAVAAVAFPDRPLISLALVIAPLIELPIMAFVAQLLRHIQPNWETH